MLVTRGLIPLKSPFCWLNPIKPPFSYGFPMVFLGLPSRRGADGTSDHESWGIVEPRWKPRSRGRSWGWEPVLSGNHILYIYIYIILYIYICSYRLISPNFWGGVIPGLLFFSHPNCNPVGKTSTKHQNVNFGKRWKLQVIACGLYSWLFVICVYVDLL